MTHQNPSSIAGLDQVVLDALDFHAAQAIKPLDIPLAGRCLVVASGNALPTGRILLGGRDAIFCDEGAFEDQLGTPGVTQAIVISASGGKHAPGIVTRLVQAGLAVYLVTCTGDSPAAKLLPAECVFVTGSITEPLTYNTSTYLGMVLSRTREDPAAIKRHILEVVAPQITDMSDYGAFYLMVESRFEPVLEMFTTKFDELFGGRINGRCYTYEQTKHAKTVVPWERELFISFGLENTCFGTQRCDIALNQSAGFAAIIAIGYYVIGRIQAQLPPWFKGSVEAYAVVQKSYF